MTGNGRRRHAGGRDRRSGATILALAALARPDVALAAAPLQMLRSRRMPCVGSEQYGKISVSYCTEQR